MNFWQKFLETPFNTQLDQWEKNLRQELKLTGEGKPPLTKANLEGMNWPLLSLAAPVTTLLPLQESWKKASQTYAYAPEQQLKAMLEEDLAAGVRVFFFQHGLKDSQEEIIHHTLKASAVADELKVFRPGNDQELISGRAVMEAGGNNVQELAALTCQLIDSLSGPSDSAEIQLAVYLDASFFKNIAKIRAAKLLGLKVLQELKLSRQIITVGLTSYRDWTLYERYSNILRNNVAVASALIGQADFIQSSGYQIIFELENLSTDQLHHERSRRLARNTSHILSLESMLGLVQDAGFGSYHLENLTQAYAEAAWKMMQQSIDLAPDKRESFFAAEVAPIRLERQERFNTRKHIMAGLNDFPDASEHLKLAALPTGDSFRVARNFECLRLKMENIKSPPRVYVALFGEYSALNARLNFVKNYFELLGLSVQGSSEASLDVGKFKKDWQERQEEILVLCALDSDYPQLRAVDLSVKNAESFIAGKYSLPGFKNLYAGQDVYTMLAAVVQKWESK